MIYIVSHQFGRVTHGYYGRANQLTRRPTTEHAKIAVPLIVASSSTPLPVSVNFNQLTFGSGGGGGGWRCVESEVPLHLTRGLALIKCRDFPVVPPYVWKRQ